MIRLTIIAPAVGFFILFCSFWAEAQEELNFGKEASIQLSYNFGQVKEGDKITHIFKILNSSEFMWKIKKIVTSCGCVSAKLIDEMKEVNSNIGPGEVLQIKMEIDTTGHKGEMEQFVYVNIMQENESKILKLVMEAEVIKK